MQDEVDFKATIARAKFEELCEDLFDRVAFPVEQALKSADMTMVRWYVYKEIGTL